MLLFMKNAKATLHLYSIEHTRTNTILQKKSAKANFYNQLAFTMLTNNYGIM